MDYFEASYWMRDKENRVIYLGTNGGNLREEDLNDPNPLLSYLSTKYNELLCFGSNLQFIPEDGAKVDTYITKKDQSTIKIDLWLANSPPVQNVDYLGKNPPNMKYGLSVEAHCWNMYRPANIVDIDTNLVFMLNEFRKLKDSFPANRCILRFKMFMDDLFHFPYIYGYFVPLENVTICKEKLIVDEGRYLLEFCGMYQAFYFTVNKAKYDSGEKLTEADLTMLD